MFHIGQRILCIHDVSSPSANEFQNVPLKGSIYTVRGFVSLDIGYERTPGMLLEEIMNPPWEYKKGRLRAVISLLSFPSASAAQDGHYGFYAHA